MTPLPFSRYLLLFLSFLAGCTALETRSVLDARFDQAKPHVGQYYFLPKALITIEGTADADGNYLVSTSTHLVADHRYRYFLRWKPNAFSEDTIANLEVDSDGTLTSVNYSAEDKTPAIIGDVVTTGINLFKIAGQLGVNRAAGEAPAKRPPFKYTFDPFDAAETAKVRRELQSEQSIKLDIFPDPGSLVRHVDRAIDPQSGGVFYHPPTTLEFLITDKSAPSQSNKKAPLPSKGLARADTKASPTPATGSPPDAAGSPDKPGTKSTSGSPATHCRLVITVPDQDRVVCFALSRAFMTKRDANLTFAHGMPTKLVFKQPSAVQAITGTLSAVTTTVAGAVPTLIKVSDDRKIAALQEQTSLVTEQSKLLEAQKKLIDDQNAFAKASATGSPGANRSDADIAELRSASQAQRETITGLEEQVRTQKQKIKERLQSSGLSNDELKKAVEAVEAIEVDPNR
jgi:hypothetical protein